MSETTEVLDPPSSVPEQQTWLWFKKIMLATQFFIDRKPVAFEPLDGNIGVLRIAASDPQAAGLLAAASAKRGGIVLIDETLFDALKKKHPFKLPEPRSKPHVLRAFNPEPPSLRPKNQNGAAAGAASQISGRVGVGLVGGGGTDAESGKMAPVPAPPPAAPGEFIPATKRKSEIKMPVIKKASGRSLHSLAPETDAPAE